MELGAFLQEGCVVADLNVSSKDQLLRNIATRSAPFLKIDPQFIFEALLQRERLGTTGLGNGIAVPHARIDGLEKVTGFFIQLEKPIDFQAVDQEPVDLVFALFAPADAGADHLNALVEVSRALRDDALTARLRKTHDAGMLHSLLTMPPQACAA